MSFYRKTISELKSHRFMYRPIKEVTAGLPSMSGLCLMISLIFQMKEIEHTAFSR